MTAYNQTPLLLEIEIMNLRKKTNHKIQHDTIKHKRHKALQEGLYWKYASDKIFFVEIISQWTFARSTTVTESQNLQITSYVLLTILQILTPLAGFASFLSS